jgi:hypothetical protein
MQPFQYYGRSSNLGGHKSDKASQNSENVEEFLAGLRFEHRGKLDMVTIHNLKSHN